MSARVQVRVAGSSRRSPAVMVAGRGRSPRRAIGAQPRDEHDERERLRQEVVGAGVERLRLVVLAVLGREHEDRCPVAFVAERRADLEPVHARQEDVEHDRAVVAGARPARGRRVRRGRCRPRSPRRSSPRDRLGQRHLVLDHQDPHPAIVAAGRRAARARVFAGAQGSSSMGRMRTCDSVGASAFGPNRPSTTGSPPLRILAAR